MNIFEAVRDFVGVIRLREWIIEFTISDLYSVDYNKANYLMNFMATFEKYLIDELGLKNIGVHLGEINNIKSATFGEQILQLVKDDTNINYVSFKITQMNTPDYLVGNIFDIHKLFEVAKSQLDAYFDKESGKKIYFSAIEVNCNIKYLSKYYIETFNNYNGATKLFWLIESSIPVVKLDCSHEKVKKDSKLMRTESDKLGKRELSKAMFNYQLYYNYDFDNPRYFFYNFISNMYENIYVYEDKVMLSRDDSVIRCLFRLGFEDICQVLNKSEELDNVNRLYNKVLIEFPVDKGIYKLRIYTINSKNGNITNEISKMGKIENLGTLEINNLLKRIAPLLNVERVDLDDKFSRIFYLEPFEIKYIELIKLN